MNDNEKVTCCECGVDLNHHEIRWLTFGAARLPFCSECVEIVQ